MAVEAIQAVTELEERVKKQKEAAAVQNKQRLLEAQRAARLLVEQSASRRRGRRGRRWPRRRPRPRSGPRAFWTRPSRSVRR